MSRDVCARPPLATFHRPRRVEAAADAAERCRAGLPPIRRSIRYPLSRRLGQQALAEELGWGFGITSAKTGEGWDAVVAAMLRRALQHVTATPGEDGKVEAAPEELGVPAWVAAITTAPVL